jgi:hypothetical protein
MSGIIETRTALAAALSAVDGVTGYRYAPTVWKIGDSWAQFINAEPPEDGRYRNNFVQAYRVIVLLSPDPETSEVFVDAHIDALVDALAPILTVSGYSQTSINPEGTQTAFRALVITGETE